MQQRIDGERRIDIAKSTLTGLVNDVPSGDIGFAFRVFGHKEADSCRTDLEMARGAKIASVQTMNLATPIGESLRLAAADIAGRPLPHLFILVTD